MLPPSSLVKKCMPSRRSSASRPHATVSAGKAKAIRTEVQSAVHTNGVMRIRVMPGARRLMMVTTKLMPDRVEPTPLISSAQIQ